jgi:phosphoribosylanthranilate isomerase
MTTVKTKICGIKTAEALDAAIDAGAYYVGLVFFPKSPRNVDIATAAKLAAHARGRAQVVALVVDPDDAALLQIMQHVAPDMIQLHGHETPDRTAEVAAITKRPVIKAVSVASKADALRGASDYHLAADLVLFDAKPPAGAALPGGNGVAFDWSLISEAKKRAAYMLSGGLTSENVGEAIRQTGAYNVDVSSGVESAPGVKDAELIRRFLQAVKTAKQN